MKKLVNDGQNIWFKASLWLIYFLLSKEGKAKSNKGEGWAIKFVYQLLN